MAAGEESLDRLLHKATAVANASPDWTAVKQFADKVAELDDGIQSALRLLVHRIQSSNEQEALNGLLVLNACVDICGPDFHEEIGKFRFLNELIKLVSPKYLGSHTAPKVKTKVIELLFNWSERLHEQTKIKIAYEMLKKQKVVTKDPIPEDSIVTSASPRPRNTLFEDEEKSKLLQKLLHSSNREDVQAANRLIKSMVKEDERRLERVALRLSELETVKNTVRVLTEMLSTYRSGSTSSDDVEVMKEIYQTCERLQPNMFRAASEADDKDEHLGDILKANDDLTKVIEDYKAVFHSNLPATASIITTSALTTRPVVAATPTVTLAQNDQLSADISLLDLDSRAEPAAESSTNLIDDQMLLLDDAIFNPVAKTDDSLKESQGSKSEIEELSLVFDKYQAVNSALIYDSQSILKPTIPESSNNVSLAMSSSGSDSSLPEKKSTSAPSKGLEDLDLLGLSLLKQSLPPNSSIGSEFSKQPEKVSMNQMRKSNLNPIVTNSKLLILNDTLSTNATAPELSDLNILNVPIQSVKPANVPPLTLYDKNGLNVVLHFSKEKPKPDVTVVVVTSINKNAEPVTSLIVQFNAGKDFRVKLQPPSNTQLPGFNPILPLVAVTQIMLIASHFPKVQMSYKLEYKLQERMHVEAGDIELGTEF
ncbi:hypothetical protein CHUAL_011854 [Chamberlinius hualienensis]